MTNKALIEHAKETMKDLFNLSGGKMLEHEQNAYNCLRLFCIKLEKIEKIENIVSNMKETANGSIEFGDSANEASWENGIGVLISNSQAIDIYNALFEDK